MQDKQLRQLIANLHTELQDADSVDDESRAMLQQLIGDIEKLADGDEGANDAGTSAVDQVEQAALKFETEHPRLSMTLGELMDALGKLGI
jgi:hypothetical protein